MLAPPGSLSGDHPYGFRSAYISSSTSIKEPLFLDQRSALYSRNPRLLPNWVCYDSLVRKTAKDGTPVATMKRVTPIDPAWLGELAKGSRLLSLGEPLKSHQPTYDADRDAVLCCVLTKFGTKKWEIPPMQVEMFPALQAHGKTSVGFLLDDSFRWFARYLLEGKVLPELKGLGPLLSDDPVLISRKSPVAKVALLVSALSSAGVDSARALRKHWAVQDKKFLFKHLKSWVKPSHGPEARRIWMDAVKKNIQQWKDDDVM